MNRVLYIESSPRGDASTSTRLARDLLADLGHPLGSPGCDHLNIWNEDFPDIDLDFLGAKHAHLAGRSPTPSQAAIWQRVRELADRIKSADVIVLSTPIWNFDIPYRLKHLIDLVTQAGLTFTFSFESGYAPLVADRPTLVVMSSAGDYTHGPCYGQPDFATPYLASALGFLGLRDVRFVSAGPSAAPPEVVEMAVARAAERLRLLAGELVGAPA